MKKLTNAILLTSALVAVNSHAAVLNIPRIEQQTSNWCWLATSEMVLKYHKACSVDGDNNYQTSIMRYMGSSGYAYDICVSNPYACSYGAGTMLAFKITIDEYSSVSTKRCGSKLKTSIHDSSVSRAKIKTEIDNKRPIIAGINPSLRGVHGPAPEHVVVIIGYKLLKGKMYLYINDPYSYTGFNPYMYLELKSVKDGVYVVPYDKFVHSLGWQSTVFTKRSS